MLKRTMMALVLLCAAPGLAQAQGDQQALVEKARLTVMDFAADPDLEWFRRYMRSAQGILVVPQLLKAGFIIGGSGGSGVLLARDAKTGEWSPPAFYTMGSGSIGFQIGAEASEVVLLLMTAKGVESVLQTNVTLGADASIAAGPVGAGGKAATAPSLSADIISFSRAKGLYGGISLEGAVLAVRNEWNQTYYGQSASPTDIIVRRTVGNARAEPLRQAVAKVAGGT